MHFGDSAALGADACSLPWIRLNESACVGATAHAGTVDAVLSDVRGQVDAAHQLLFELRVEMQNEVCQLGERITSVADAQSDVGILADSCKATVQRTEGQVADMADKVGVLWRQEQCPAIGSACKERY